MRAPVPPLQRELQGRWEGGVRAAVAVGLVAEGGYLHHPRPRILARFENQLFWCVGFIDRQKLSELLPTDQFSLYARACNVGEQWAIQRGR
jgi:hypothetical protein